ncbi:MAG TPA: hypothetical protein ENH19_02775 [Actinobacteria bacterium]|nr:hypothetical protein [Actinomycetes bacterium]HEX21559.1 hypothetical protein [Actinomycetota bacterium]
MKSKFLSVIFIAVLIVCLTPIVGVAAASNSTHNLEKSNRIIGKLRSVTFEYQSLKDSQSQPSAALRAWIQERTAAGWSEQKILSNTVSTYGETILLAPPKQGFNLILWLTPFILIGIGAVFIALLAFSWSKKKDILVDSIVKNNKREIDTKDKEQEIYSARLAAELKKYNV